MILLIFVIPLALVFFSYELHYKHVLFQTIHLHVKGVLKSTFESFLY